MLHAANYFDRFYSLFIDDYQISFTRFIEKYQKPIAVACVSALVTTQAGQEMLRSAAKTAMYSAVGALGGLSGAYFMGMALYHQKENPRPLILSMLPVGATGFAIANAVLSIPEGATSFQKMGAVPLAGLAAGISGFFMGKIYVAQKAAEDNRKPIGSDFAIGGVRTAALVALASLLTGANASLAGALTSCALIGNKLAYMEEAAENSQAQNLRSSTTI